MNSTRKFHILLMILLARLGFIFMDAFSQKNIRINIGSYFSKNNSGTTNNIPKDVAKQVTQAYVPQQQIHPENEMEENMKKKIQNQKANIQDIKTLEYIYKQKKTPNILKEIIKKQAQNYSFNDAWSNIQILELSGDSVDIHLFLHVYLNSNNLNITQPDSISKILPILNLALQNGKIANEDYAFYIGLTEIRNKNYSKALASRKDINNPQYITIIQSFKRAIESYTDGKAIPLYYQDSLVGLAALKNGYFVIAKKISLETIFQNDNYILPYQILSYSHFLTDNRDTAIEYFLKLANFDKKNQETYQFLIGVSYYWKQDFTSSIIYLTQNKGDKYKTDTLRYLIVDYLAINEPTKALEYWQQLLGQPDIKNSDFFYYFYNVFYKPYLSKDYVLYRSNKQLSTLFLQQCDKVLGTEDNVCVYGKIGLEVITNSLSPKSEIQLVGLSETYNQSYFYHILGDVFSAQGKIEDAKKRYAKTIANSQDTKEVEVVQKKLSDL